MISPRIKPEHTAYRTIDGNIRIGSTIHGPAAELVGPPEWLHGLFDVMDGVRAPADIAVGLTERHPGLAESDVFEALEQLHHAGFIEDSGAALPDELSPRDLERYSRGMPFFRWIDREPRTSSWDFQVRLRNARALLIGLGGSGGAAGLALAASGVGHLHCVDGDSVELSNLNRQTLYREADIGRPKADTAVERLRSVNSDVEIHGETRSIGGQEDFAVLLRDGYDVLVLCADEPAAIRRWANRACLETGTAWVTGGYHGPVVSAGMYVPGSGACWECLHEQEARQVDLRLPSDVPASGIEPNPAWSPATAVSAALSGNLVAHAALTLLTGAPPIEPGIRFGFNLAAPGESLAERHPVRADCPACAGRG
jgi:molybdopterin/thiamine biosynthesis adenylyltransferase